MKCILCHGERFVRVYSNERVTIVRCHGCGLVQQDDYAASLARLNSSFDTVDAYYERRTAVAGPKREANHKPRDRTADIRQEIVRRIGPNARLLDVGCGNGEFISALRQLGIDVVGVEPDLVRAGFGRKHLGLEIVSSAYREAIFPSGHFDAITFIQTLEHMENPLEALVQARRHLKSGGLLVVDVPSFNNLRVIAYSLTHLQRLVLRDFIPSHSYYFTRHTLSRLVKKAGFDVDKAVTGRYLVKLGRGKVIVNALMKVADKIANRLGIGGITLYGRKK